MRTTVTLDPDAEHIVRARMATNHESFKQALNGAIRDGAGSRPTPAPFVTKTHALGQPLVSLDRALRLAADIEDEEYLRRLSQGS